MLRERPTEWGARLVSGLAGGGWGGGDYYLNVGSVRCGQTKSRPQGGSPISAELNQDEFFGALVPVSDTSHALVPTVGHLGQSQGRLPFLIAFGALSSGFLRVARDTPRAVDGAWESSVNPSRLPAINRSPIRAVGSRKIKDAEHARVRFDRRLVPDR